MLSGQKRSRIVGTQGCPVIIIEKGSKIQEQGQTVSTQEHMKGVAVNFGFILFPDLEELDLVGPWEMVAMWSQYADGPEKCLMIAETKEPVRCSNGMVIQPHISFEDAPQLDYLLIPGGFGTRDQVDNQRLISFVSKQANNCKAIFEYSQENSHCDLWNAG